ncbi:MAG: type II secretion system F family protein [Verrucomicrobiota bacterium]
MPLIVTPRQLSHRSELYHQLASLTAAGVTLIQGLEMVHRSPPARSFRVPVSKLIQQLNCGSTLTESLKSLGQWIPSFDIALVEAGEKSGRLDACFRLLADYYKERAQLARSVISELTYPVFVFHFAVLLFPVALLKDFVFGSNPWVFLWQKISVLLPLYTAIFLLLYACQGKRGESWRAWIEKLVGWIPILGIARRHLALARLSAALEALINAGVSIIDAWDMAATASGSPALRRTVSAAKPRVLAGDTPGEVICELPIFPELFASLYRTGEISGKLDSTLRRLHALYQEDASRKLQAVAQWTPRLVYFIILLAIAYQIVGFYTGYFNQMNQFL